jgi:hypothetical protein
MHRSGAGPIELSLLFLLDIIILIIVTIIYYHDLLPSGKRLHSELENHHFIAGKIHELNGHVQ